MTVRHSFKHDIVAPRECSACLFFGKKIVVDDAPQRGRPAGLRGGGASVHAQAESSLPARRSSSQTAPLLDRETAEPSLARQWTPTLAMSAVVALVAASCKGCAHVQARRAACASSPSVPVARGRPGYTLAPSAQSAPGGRRQIGRGARIPGTTWHFRVSVCGHSAVCGAVQLVRAVPYGANCRDLHRTIVCSPRYE